MKFKRNADKFGRDFGRDFEKTRPNNSLSKFAEKFTGTFPKFARPPPKKTKSALQNLGLNNSSIYIFFVSFNQVLKTKTRKLLDNKVEQNNT